MVKQGDKVWFKTKDGKLIQGVLKGKQVITGKKKYRPPLDNLHPTLETARKSVWRSKIRASPKKQEKTHLDILRAIMGPRSGSMLAPKKIEIQEAPPKKQKKKKKKKTFTPHNTQAPNRVDLKKVNKPTPPPPTMDDFMDVMHVMGERGKQKNPEGRILELSMNRHYTDRGLLNYLDENWEGIVGTDWDSIFRDWQSYDEYGNEIWRKRFKTKKEATREWNKIQGRGWSVPWELGMEYNLSVIDKTS